MAVGRPGETNLAVERHARAGITAQECVRRAEDGFRAASTPPEAFGAGLTAVFVEPGGQAGLRLASSTQIAHCPKPDMYVGFGSRLSPFGLHRRGLPELLSRRAHRHHPKPLVTSAAPPGEDQVTGLVGPRLVFFARKRNLPRARPPAARDLAQTVVTSGGRQLSSGSGQAVQLGRLGLKAAPRLIQLAPHLRDSPRRDREPLRCGVSGLTARQGSRW